MRDAAWSPGSGRQDRVPRRTLLERSVGALRVSPRPGGQRQGRPSPPRADGSAGATVARRLSPRRSRPSSPSTQDPRSRHRLLPQSRRSPPTRPTSRLTSQSRCPTPHTHGHIKGEHRQNGVMVMIRCAYRVAQWLRAVRDEGNGRGSFRRLIPRLVKWSKARRRGAGSNNLSPRPSNSATERKTRRRGVSWASISFPRQASSDW